MKDNQYQGPLDVNGTTELIDASYVGIYYQRNGRYSIGLILEVSIIICAIYIYISPLCYVNTYDYVHHS